MHVKNALVVDYDTGKHDFRGLFRRVLDYEHLDKLHERPDIAAFGPYEVKEQIDVCRRAIGEAFPQMAELYADFVRTVIGEHFGGVQSWQTPPSFRFHYSRRGSSSTHRDRDFGVKSGRLNAWVPLTRVWGDNSISIESEEGKGDLTPVELDYGQVLIFDGGNLLHGGRWNSTSCTRVSFDLRFIPVRFPEPA